MSLSLHAQDVLSMHVDLDVKNVSILTAINQLEKSADITFAYSRNRIPLERKVSITQYDIRLEDLLNELFIGTGIQYQAKNRQIILYRNGQEEFTISGYVRDRTSHELLFGANIYEVGAYRGVYSNNSGFYSLTLPKGNYKILTTYIGYQTSIDSIHLNDNIEMDIYMDVGGSLTEILIVANPIQKNQEFIVKRKNDANHKIDVEKLNNLPSFFGEEDVMMYLQLIPGTSSNGVLGSNINVRGSESDQNMILLDGIPVYNTLHLFGIASIFDENTVKSIDAYSKGFSAVYGGKLSSIMDVRLKEGDKNHYHANASLGLLSVKAFLEGPIQKGKSSFFASFRHSFVDLLIDNKGTVSISPTPSYYDFNIKTNFDLSSKDKLSLSYYQGQDALEGVFDSIYNNPVGLDSNSHVIYEELGVQGGSFWGNTVTAANWYHRLNRKTYLTTTLHFSKYNFEIGESRVKKDIHFFDLNYRGNVRNKGLKIQLDFRPNTKHYFNFGAGTTWINTDPGKSKWSFFLNNQHVVNERNAKIVNTQEYYFFAEDEFRLNPLWTVQMGIYTSILNADAITFFNPQPRLKFKYSLSNRSKIEASYSKMVQYDRVIDNSNLVLGANMWLPSTRKVRPQEASHFSIDYTLNVDTIWKITSAIYYKNMKHLVRPILGANVYNSVEDWEDRIVFGKGNAYGFELMMEKTKGQTRGWISYYLGKSVRQFDELNQGESYLYKFSKTHNINIVLLHQFKSKKSKKEIGLTWQFSSGYLGTIPTRWHYDINGHKILDYGKLNNYRFPASHKLNLAYTWSRNTKRGNNWTLKMGIYNVYSQFNVFNDELEFTEEGDYNLILRSFTNSPIPYMTFNFGLNH